MVFQAKTPRLSLQDKQKPARRPPNNQKKQQETPMKSSRTTNPFPSLRMPNACAKTSFVSLQAPCRLVIIVHEELCSVFRSDNCFLVSGLEPEKLDDGHLPAGTTMIMIKMAMPMPSQMRIFMSCAVVSTRKLAMRKGQGAANLPPHCLAHSVGPTAKALGRRCQVIGLVLKGVETLATLRHLVNVVSHHTDSVVDLLE
jgi:hypothetical protein